MIKEELKNYIENYIFEEYNKNEQAHGVDHIKYVINRCIELSKNYDININMLYVIAAYHDIGHHIDAKKHEIISANIMYEDKKLRDFFTEEELKIMKEAIEDHRASLDREPRSIYGKLVSSADRGTSVDESIKRTYFYRKKHSPELTDEEIIEDSYKHLEIKFGKEGYAKFYVKDEKYENFLKEIRGLIENKEEFIKRYKKIIFDIKNNI